MAASLPTSLCERRWPRERAQPCNGSHAAEEHEEGDFRRYDARWQGENYRANKRVVDRLLAVFQASLGDWCRLELLCMTEPPVKARGESNMNREATVGVWGTMAGASCGT